MNRALKCESYRVRNSKSTYVYIAVAVLTSAAVQILVWFLQNLKIGSLDLELGAENIYESFCGYGHSIIIEIGSIIFLSGLIIHLYTSGVMKQVVSSGQKRSSFILGQYFAFLKYILLIAVIGATVDSVCTLIFMKTDNKLYAASFVVTLIGVMVSLASEVAMIMLAAHFFTNMGAATIILLLITQFSSTAMLGLDALFKTDAFTKYCYTGLQDSAITYGTKVQADQIKAIAILAVLTMVFLMLTTVVFDRKEVK